MSDLLSGLRATGDDPVDEAWNDCLDGVREALRHPTDEQVEAIALAVWDKALGVGVEEVRAVLAAAGGDAVRGETQ